MSAGAALYAELLDGAREELVAALGRHRYRLWFRDAEVVKVSGRSVTLAVPTEVHRTWLEFNYRALLDRAFGRVLGDGVHVEVTVSSRLAATRTIRDEIPDDDASWRTALRDGQPAPTLLSFVAEAENAFVLRVVGQALHGSDVTSPATLYLYGEPGTGKTHLVRALHAAASAEDPAASLLLNARALTARVVPAVRERDLAALASLDEDLASRRLVVVDGLDELEDRPTTQRTLETLFDRARSRGVRVVVTARSHPHGLPGLSERLRSRLLAGLVLRLSPATAAQRERILAERAQAWGVPLPEPVRAAVLARATTLPGAVDLVDRWAYVSRRLGRPLDPSHLHEVAAAASPTSPREEVVRRAKDVVAEHFGVDRRVLDRPTKHPNVLEARRAAMYLVWRAAALPLTELARAFGLRAHSAASRALAEVRSRRDVDPAFESTLDGLVRRL